MYKIDLRIISTIAILSVFSSVTVLAQDGPAAKRARSHGDYQSRTLSELIALQPDTNDLRDKRGTLVVTSNIVPSMIQVRYTGSTRLVSGKKKEVIRQWARLYAGSMEHYTTPYQNEMLFVADGIRYWFAVPTNSELLKHQLKKGDALNLYLIRLGGLIVGDKYDWVFLVEDFQKAKPPEVEVAFRGMRLGRPPLAYLKFDVLLRNNNESPMWFLVPSNLGSGRAPVGVKGGVDTLQVFLPGEGKVVIGRFLGTGGFNAMFLAPHATIRLRQFPIAYWGEPPRTLPIEIVVAKRLSIGGEPAANWFGEPPLTAVDADIDEDAEDEMKVRRSKHAPDDKEVAVTFEVARRFQVKVALPKR